MNRYLLLFSILLFSFKSNGQEKSTLSGKVLDENGAPLQFVNIQLEGSRLGTSTDHEGYFIIKNVPPGTYTMIFTSVGFVPFKQIVSLESPDGLNITLKEDPHVLPQLYIVGNRDQMFSKTPGSVSYFDQEEIQRIQPLSGNEVFRRAPGVHVVDEEGAGLRVNIGIRGLDPDRSRNVLILEDGVPVALNPYGEPEMYYTPAIDRMSGVEILKGSGQILYGPQTIGGVVNYITANPPEEQEIGFRLQGGQGGYLSSLLRYGNTFNKAGVQINYLRKQADAIGSTNFLINDFSGKIRLPLSQRSTLGIKIAAYSEVSNSTYVGITQAMYNNRGNDFSVMVPNDELDVNRYSLNLSHRQEISSSLSLESLLYGYSTTRNWRRQDYAYNSYTEGTLNPPPADWTGVMWGDESVPGGAIYLRNRTGNRDRQFEVLGWEQKIKFNSSFGSIQNEFTGGYRLIYERAYEQRINGATADAKSGALVSDEIRTGKAISFYVLDKITLSNKLDIAPGIRAESYYYEREVLRESSVDEYRLADNRIFEIIPGIGLNYRPDRRLNVFGGVHRGYAPPRVKDAIDFSFENPVLELDAEKSWNYELGLRTTPIKGVYAEATYFYMDFSNQIIPSSQSIGGVGFGFTNAGRTLHRGIESSINLNTKEIANTPWTAILNVSATYVKATFHSDRLMPDGNENVNVRGKRLPYAPELTLSAAGTIESPFGTGLRLTYTLVGNQYADPLNTKTPANNGRIGFIDRYNLMDATLYHNIPKWKTTFNLSVKNLTDERYIVSRRPEGIRVGIPRFITAGVDVKF